MRNFTKDQIIDLMEYRKSLKFDVRYSNQGVARIYINEYETPIYAGGYGYDKTSTVLASLLNLLTKKDVIKRQRKAMKTYALSCTHKNGLFSGGVGTSAIIESVNSLNGCELKEVYWNDVLSVFELTVSEKFLAVLKEEGIEK